MLSLKFIILKGERMETENKIELNKMFSLKELNKMPTIDSGQADDLKYETKDLRVWLSRMTIADGMEYNNQVSIDAIVNGKWHTLALYEAL